jgi:hypothetical protein
LTNVCSRLRKSHASGRSNEAEICFAASHFCISHAGQSDSGLAS